MIETDRNEQNNKVVTRVYELIEPLCIAEGFELVHVEYQRESGGRILRIYIDKPGGVTIDDCADISRQAGDILDVSIENDWSYNLEVSSPGFDRPLVRPQDFEKFKGFEAKIKIDKPLNGQRNFKGTLLGISDNDVHVSIDNKTVNIPFKEITKARLVG